jgi:hypothetical protein
VFVGADDSDEATPKHGKAWKNAFKVVELIIHHKFDEASHKILNCTVSILY